MELEPNSLDWNGIELECKLELEDMKHTLVCHWASYLALLNDLLCGGEGKISYREEKLFEYVLHSWNKAEIIRISETENFPPDNKSYR